MNTDHLELVKSIIIKETKQEPIEIKRMVIGICNEVYSVIIPSKKVVVRMNTEAKQLNGTERNIKLLSSLGIKVPEVIASDYSKSDCPMAYQVLSFIDGQDLGQVIESMTDEQLIDLAKEIANIFNKLATIPTNGRFGWVGADESGLVDSWAEIMKQDKIEERNNQTGIVGNELVAKEKELFEKYKPYFNSVKSTLYYDDISSKNVMIHDGKFAGLIDLDTVIYGDPLEAVGAIKTCWYGTHHGEVYTNAVERELGLNEEQKNIVTVYALFNRILWLSEKGVKFNENTSTDIDEEAVKSDRESIDKLFLELGYTI
jgi:aminoglycoside phosphotransferase (APT) family kinase protein